MKYFLISLALIGLLIVLAPNHDVNALELEAPPLLWEESPEASRQQDLEYWKRKYGIRKKTKSAADDAKDDKADKATTKIEDEAKKVEQSSENSDSEPEGEAKDDTKSSVVVDKDDIVPPCEYDWAMNQKAEDLDFEKFGDRPVRIVYKGQKLTKDVNLSRVNLRIGTDGRIMKIACF